MRASDQKQKKRKEYEVNVRQKKNICTHAHAHGLDVMRDMIVRFQDNRQVHIAKIVLSLSEILLLSWVFRITDCILYQYIRDTAVTLTTAVNKQSWSQCTTLLLTLIRRHW